tara:strand:+ start:5751 stop:6341 length:591 start_codon:yes stop_codon:yes gene_type:complete
MSLKLISSGFLVKTITGFDDTMTQIPIVGAVARTKYGRIAFSIGILLAVTTAIILSFLFASAIKNFAYHKYLVSGLLVIIALTVYFDVQLYKPKNRVIKRAKQIQQITKKRFLKLLGIGFIAAFITVIDDSVAYSSALLGAVSSAPFVILGIYIALFLELIIIVYFSSLISKFKYKKQIATLGLLTLALLVFLEIL